MTEIIPLKASLGARIEGLDGTRAAEPATAALLGPRPCRAPAGRHSRQAHGAGGDARLLKAFGEPQRQLLRYKRSGAVPDVSVMVSTLMADGTTDKTAIRAEDWHTDDSYFAVAGARRPCCTASRSRAMAAPPGSATCIRYSRRCREATRKRIDGMKAIHGYDTVARATGRRRARPRRSPRRRTSSIRWCGRIPRRAARRLYLNPIRLDRIVGLEQRRERCAARRAGR